MIGVNVTVLSRAQVASLKSVRTFLESKSRNSTSTPKTYLTALFHFNNFLSPNRTAETIIQSLAQGETNVYELLDSFLAGQSKKVSTKTLRLHLAAVVSYLGYHDIDIVPAKFKKKVTVPKLRREDEQAIDVSDIRQMLLKCDNRRLKTYLLVLASGGLRAVEGLAIRIKDIDFTVSPTKIHVRGEYAKTRVARDIYISDEATQALKARISWKYRGDRPKAKDDLVFGVGSGSNPSSLYSAIAHEFSKNLELAGFTERKENSIRHTVTLTSLRRFVDSTITDLTGKDYAEWFLGHAKSSYYTKKEPERREIYATKCIKYLTFLDYSLLEAAGHSTEADLEIKSKEIAALKQQNQIMSKQLADVIEQQQQHANTFDMKFAKLLEIVKTGSVDQDEATRSFISGEIVKMMPRKLTTKELQKIESRHNLTGVFIDSTPD